MEAKYIAWRGKYVRSCAQGLYVFYNEKGDNGDAVTCSEAHGYGMLISVLHRNQQDFDGMLRYFLAFRNENGLMQWQQQINKRTHEVFTEMDEGNTCATDGDIDIATALFLASRIFPHGGPAFPQGAYAYEAAQLSSALLNKCIHRQLNTPLLGDWCNTGDRKNERLYNSTRTSDFILSAFLLFYRMHPDPNQRARWQAVLEATLSAALSQVPHHAPVGILPDFLEWDGRCWKPAQGKLLESKNDGEMSWNACRTPWRLAHYYAVSGDSRVLPLLQRMHQTLSTHPTFPALSAGFRLKDAKALEDYTDRAFIAPASYLCYVLSDHGNHSRGLAQLEEEESSYFGDSIDLVIGEMATFGSSGWA
ncbi:hypothetical protein A4X13_0g7965 [Tilletia indica]|uniref:Uncharacterized protein n=1 Tax=Tilletia indica TaxID=43049 RepID=A0A177TQ09_9BASI|nr:hypothetical protein A4X13_0g7965 [Tilletia indica]